MGVINLGLLVDKIKRKLESSGFIKNTDYATASAAGVVKIGDNIDVDDGVISVTFPAAGGFTMDKLFDNNVAQGSDIEYTLTAAYTGYKFLVVTAPSASTPDFGKIMVVEDIANGTNNLNPSGIVNLRFDSEDATKFKVPQGSGTKAIKIYGCK